MLSKSECSERGPEAIKAHNHVLQGLNMLGPGNASMLLAKPTITSPLVLATGVRLAILIERLSKALSLPAWSLTQSLHSHKQVCPAWNLHYENPKIASMVHGPPSSRPFLQPSFQGPRECPRPQSHDRDSIGRISPEHPCCQSKAYLS